MILLPTSGASNYTLVFQAWWLYSFWYNWLCVAQPDDVYGKKQHKQRLCRWVARGGLAAVLRRCTSLFESLAGLPCILIQLLTSIFHFMIRGTRVEQQALELHHVLNDTRRASTFRHLCDCQPYSCVMSAYMQVMMATVFVTWETTFCRQTVAALPA